MNEPNKGVICHRPWSGFELYDHLGDVRPCCWGKLSCGNINTSSVEQIWNGNVYRYYREQMLQANTDAICSPSCPILNGHYQEVASDLWPKSQTPSAAQFEVVASPSFLRVVPTTRCNLKCKMCYQIGDPPPMLPPGLFQILEPWILEARELQLLGGEPFIAPECLDWIRCLSPDKYPNLRLCAITNGLGFTDSVCRLIRERQWNWILVSIDAASATVYKRVRGGDFRVLLRGLHDLADTRRRARMPFEIRFGFTLQKSNLADAIPFLDLCSEYGAIPQFTLVFGEWHGESPQNRADAKAFISTLEEVDKVLCLRGFTNRLVASTATALTSRIRRSELMGPIRILPYMDSPRESKEDLSTQISRSDRVLAFSDGEMTVSGSSDIDHQLEGVGHLVFRIGMWNRTQMDEVKRKLSHCCLSSFAVDIPYFEKGAALSALRVRSMVEELIAFGLSKDWKCMGGHANPSELGFVEKDEEPRLNLIYTKASGGHVALSIVSAMRNCQRELEDFLRSVDDQEGSGSFELILVDDGSTDESVQKALELLPAMSHLARVTLMTTGRRTRYIKGTFTFGAGLAREIGRRVAVGSRILFIDADQVVERHCAQEHLDWGKRGFAVVIGDRMSSALDLDTPWHRLRQEALNRQQHWWLSFFTGNSSVSSGLLADVGGFDCALQYWGLDDTDLAYRLYLAGASVWHTPRARVIHLTPESSGGGSSHGERLQNYRLHMEVLYRKYLRAEICDAFSFSWRTRL